MSTISLHGLPPDVREHPPIVLKLDERRGTIGMWLFIATEGALFLMLFVAYFYLAKGGWNWPLEAPPKLRMALPMLAVLLISSAVLHWGEKKVQARAHRTGRAALSGTILIGLIFLVMQVFEYRDHLKSLTPQTSVYGSIFYTLTSFHALHLIVGLCILAYVLILPDLEPTQRSPHRPYHNAAIYWHFVDFVWIWIVLFLYVSPHFR